MTTNPDPKKYARLGRIKSSGAVVFIHPCVVCGERNASFGTGVFLRKATAEHNKGKLGKWYCVKHKPEKRR